MKRKYKIGIIIALVVLFNPLSLFLSFVGLCLWSNTHPDTGQNVSSVSWLPAEATHVSYFKTYSYTAYEFDISEEGFKNWASDWEMKEIETPFTTKRYSAYTLAESETTATITNGYCFQTPPRDNGGETLVAYDRDRKRAFYKSNPR